MTMDELKHYIPEKYLKHISKGMCNSNTYLAINLRFHSVEINTDYLWGENEEGLFYKDIQLNHTTFDSLLEDLEYGLFSINVLIQLFMVADQINESPISRELFNIKPVKK